MDFTSAYANKYLKSLKDDRARLVEEERRNCTYTYLANEENICIPDYSYDDVKKALAEIDLKELKVRTALHRFNMETMINDEYTIDGALVRLAQLNTAKRRLERMGNIPKHERRLGAWMNSSAGVEWTDANFDTALVTQDYKDVCRQIVKLQLAIDRVNNTKTFWVDID